MYPSRVTIPFFDSRSITSKRDFAGEIATAVRKKGLKCGVYYCNGLDWTFYRTPVYNSYTKANIHGGRGKFFIMKSPGVEQNILAICLKYLINGGVKMDCQAPLCLPEIIRVTTMNIMV